MVTIKDYLQQANPSLQILTKTTQSTDSLYWEPIEGFEDFTDFNYDTLKSLYGDVLNHEFEAKDLPVPNTLLPMEREIFSERELEQDPVKRHILAKVNYAVRAAYKRLARKDRTEDFDHPPVIVCGTKVPPNADTPSGPLPDWIGRQQGYSSALICGETKLSTVFNMPATVSAPDHRFDKPVEQCLHYCIMNDTRYGFMITDRELVVFRIRQEEIAAGLASQRPRRAIPPNRISYGGSSLASSTQAMSLYSDSGPQGPPKYVAYRSIEWSATKGLTICLALFFLTLMAAAPGVDITISDDYASLNLWEWNAADSHFTNNTNGRVREKLKEGHIEFIKWMEGKDTEGRTYFSSYKGNTYLQQLWNQEAGELYIYNHHAQTSFTGTLGQKDVVRTYGDIIRL